MNNRFFSLFLLLVLLVTLPGCAALMSGSGAGNPQIEPAAGEAPAATPERIQQAGESQATASTFCPEVPRPALLLTTFEEEHLLLDPDSGARCELPLALGPGIMPQVGGEALFYTDATADGGKAVYRLEAGGTAAALPVTAITEPEAASSLIFLVSDDGTMISWVTYGPDEDFVWTLSDLFVAPVSLDKDVAAVALATNDEPEKPEVLQPIRFSEDHSLLYYTVHPIGASPNAIGRYRNLYAIPTAGGDPQLVFDCAALELRGLCLGDFQVRDNQVVALAYTDSDRGEVVLGDGAGEEVGRFAQAADYVGFPTFAPGGDLVFYKATRSVAEAAPDEAVLYHVAAPAGEADAVATAPVMVLPNRFLEDGRLLVDYPSDFDNMEWTVAVVSAAGEMQVVEAYPHAYLSGVLR